MQRERWGGGKAVREERMGEGAEGGGGGGRRGWEWERWED